MKTGTNRNLFVALLLWLFIVPGSLSKEDLQREQALQFITKVRELTDIRAAGSPPFRLQASFEAAPPGKAAVPLHGTLLLTWFAPGEWRESITLPNFTQVRVASLGKLWTSRNVPYENLRAFQIEELIDIRKAWTLWPDESFSNVKMKKVNGVAASCVDVETNFRPERQICADPASLTPVASMPAYSILGSGEYSDYLPWGTKQFPRLMRGFEDKKLVIELRVEDLTPNAASAGLQLSPPPDATVWNSCDNPEPARVVSTVRPHYPEGAKQAGKEGRVTVYFVIADDGSVGSLAVVRSAGPDFDAATVTSVSGRRYRPAMCGGRQVATEEVSDVHFTMAY